MQRRLTFTRGVIVLACGMVVSTALLFAVIGPGVVAACGAGALSGLAYFFMAVNAPLLAGGALGGLGFAAVWAPMRSVRLWLGLAALSTIVSYGLIEGAKAAYPIPSNPHSCVI